ncbi:MAG TPA: multicopper oxidase domain-containing protein [Steroidobacteraceae bacterium]|nr:multicopper oxidase domain-containing protein [Steroidobacteraceae bacterium]
MFSTRGWIAFGLTLFALPAMGQSFRVQCPTSTITHPGADNNHEPAYSAATYVPVTGTADYTSGKTGPVNGAIKCQQISGGDGYATMADGTQTYLFSFGPLSGLADIAQGRPGTEFPSVFNNPFPVSTTNFLVPGDPATTVDGVGTSPISGGFLQPLSPGQLARLAGAYNGAVGQDYDSADTFTIYDISESGNTVTVVLNSQAPFQLGDQVVIAQGNGTDLNGYVGTFTVTAVNVANGFFPPNFAFQYSDPATGLADVNGSSDATASYHPAIDGHVDPRQIMDVGVMNGNIPAPLMAIDEDDEFFLTLTNVGMIMRPDLFEQHTVHFHGYPNASSFYDGVPDASVAINIAASFTYYYLAPEAGTYFWHCHITPPEHLQMGMVGQIYVRPRQDRVTSPTHLYAALQTQEGDLRTKCDSTTDILCSNPLPAGGDNLTTGGFTGDIATSKKFAYNDGDGSTYYDVEYPVQMHSFDPNFHFVGMTFNPEGFADMKDKYFLLNGRSYPDTVNPDPLQTQSADGVYHFSQPLPTIINIPAGSRALLRLSNLNVTEEQTLASLGVPMQVIALNAKLLRDQAGNNLYYTTNSITLGGGESLDVILDTCTVARTDPSQQCPAANLMPKGTYYLYTPNLDHLSNDAENFGGQMTEVRVN